MVAVQSRIHNTGWAVLLMLLVLGFGGNFGNNARAEIGDELAEFPTLVSKNIYAVDQITAEVALLLPQSQDLEPEWVPKSELGLVREGDLVWVVLESCSKYYFLDETATHEAEKNVSNLLEKLVDRPNEY